MNSIPSTLLRIATIPWLLFVPGYLTQLWFVSRRPLADRRNWLETGFISLLFSVCLVGWVALVLVELGWFSLARLLFLVIAYCVAVGLLIRAQGGRKARDAGLSLGSRLDGWGWILVIVVLISAVLYFHPHEYIMGGGDAGVYVNLGGHIARGGSLRFNDPEISSLSPELYPALFREQPSHLITRYIQFPGFYLSDDQAGLVIPQFYPLHPTWLAIFHSVGGLRASLYVTPMWGALGVLAIGLTAATLFGRRTGALAAALLAIGATQIWFSRYPTSEALTQLLLFGGIYAFSRYMVDESPEMGVLAGLSLGQVMLVRLDTYFLLAIPLGLVAYLRVTRRLTRRVLAFLIPFLALSVHSLAHGLLQSWPYLHNSYRYQLRGLVIPALAVGCGVTLVGLLLLDFWAGGQAERLSRLAHSARRGAKVLGVLVVLAALYAYFIRPEQADPTRVVPNWYAENEIPNVEPYNLVRLGWYLSPLGIALAVLGWWWMLRRDVTHETALFLGVGLFFSFLYLQYSRNNPHHIYVMRRYVPAVIPAFSIAAAYFIDRWWRRQDRWRWLAWGLALTQVALLVYAARIVVRQVDHRGLVSQLSPWVESLDPDAVILFDDDRPVSTGATVGTALRFLFNRTVFDLQETFLTDEIFQSLVERWRAQGRKILVAVGPQGVREPFVRWPLAALPALWLDTRVLESSYFHFPKQVRRATVALELFELQPVASEAATALRVDVGSSDSFYLGEGWHDKERLPDGTTMRWTSGMAQLILPPETIGDGNVRLRIQMAASATSGENPTEVQLRYCSAPGCSQADEMVSIVTWQVGTTFAAYDATLPTSQQGPLVLWIETSAWSPLALGLSGDARDLGVMVDWIDVRREE